MHDELGQALTVLKMALENVYDLVLLDIAMSDRGAWVCLRNCGAVNLIGKTASEIAGNLILSVKTIGTNRARALQKMAMKNNAEFTNYAIREGLVQ